VNPSVPELFRIWEGENQLDKMTKPLAIKPRALKLERKDLLYTFNQSAQPKV